MAEIIKVFREQVPAMRFIGKKYPSFCSWEDWFVQDWFGQLETIMGGTENILRLWENGAGYVGLEHHCPGQPFEYWIGMFTPAQTPIPEGFAHVDFPAMNLGTCWVYGKEEQIHDVSGCLPAVEMAGMKLWKDIDGGYWAFENCLCPRYTIPDDQGNITLDYCYYVE